MAVFDWQTFLWITCSGLLMTLIAMVGYVTTFLSEQRLRRILTPLVAFAAGTMMSGAAFHLLPEGVHLMHNSTLHWVVFILGFLLFFVLEQFLHWHHCQRRHHNEQGHVCHEDGSGAHGLSNHTSVMILVADGVHNFVGGLGVGGAFVASPTVGILAWVAAVSHEIPQELGDFAVLVHSGMSRKKALGFNLLSAITFPIGGWISFALSTAVSVNWLIPLAAGNFLYIAAADLIPEIHKDTQCIHDHEVEMNVVTPVAPEGKVEKKVKTFKPFLRSLEHFLSFISGLALLLVIKLIFEAAGFGHDEH